MIVAKSRVILRFYHAMHAGDGDVSPAAAARRVERIWRAGSSPVTLIRTPRRSIVGAAILDFSPEFFLQFGMRNLDHGGTAVGTAVRQITSEQIAN